MVVSSVHCGVFDTSIITRLPPQLQRPFAQVLGRFTQKKAPGEVDLLGGLAFIVSFWRIVCYTGLAALLAHFIGKGVSTMSLFLSLIQSVAVNIISHYVCKWLDGLSTGRKH